MEACLSKMYCTVVARFFASLGAKTTPFVSFNMCLLFLGRPQCWNHHTTHRKYQKIKALPVYLTSPPDKKVSKNVKNTSETQPRTSLSELRLKCLKLRNETPTSLCEVLKRTKKPVFKITTIFPKLPLTARVGILSTRFIRTMVFCKVTPAWQTLYP